MATHNKVGIINMRIAEEKFIKKMTPIIEERIKYRIVQNIVNTLEEQCYPPEDMIREDFIRSVEEAEKEVKKGKSKVYTYAEFEKNFAE